MIEEARYTVLKYFSAPEDYDCIFTYNATHALHLLGESFPFSPLRGCVLTVDQHNSANGIREFALSKGGRVRYVGLTTELRVAEEDLHAALSEGSPGLFIYPAQSNFTGVKHPLNYVNMAQEKGHMVLLDASAFVPTNMLDLSAVQPEFIILSFYKMFGYPTGVGCLIAKKDALQELRTEKPWFAGSTIFAVITRPPWHVLLKGPAAFEEGTPNYQSIFAIPMGLEYLQNIGLGTINDRVMFLTGWLLDNLRALRHSNGSPMVKIYGPENCTMRGPTVSINFLTPEGELIDERIVNLLAAKWDTSIRTGCFCNPGAGEEGMGVSTAALQRQAGIEVKEPPETLDPWLEQLGLRTAGAIRLSIGFPNTFEDIEAALRFAQGFKDFVAFDGELPLRLGC
jgi:selenocysteine lyase/cysteine desulfurase